MNYRSFGLMYYDLVLNQGLESHSCEDEKRNVGVILNTRGHVPCCLCLIRDDWYEVQADMTMSALNKVYEEYQQHGVAAFGFEFTKQKKVALRLVSNSRPAGLYIYQSLRPKAQWRLSEVLRYRHLTNQQLAEQLSVSKVTISRWRRSHFIPAIGGEEMLRLCEAITALSNPAFPPAQSSDLLSIS